MHLLRIPVGAGKLGGQRYIADTVEALVELISGSPRHPCPNGCALRFLALLRSTSRRLSSRGLGVKSRQKKTGILAYYRYPIILYSFVTTVTRWMGFRSIVRRACQILIEIPSQFMVCQDVEAIRLCLLEMQR